MSGTEEEIKQKILNASAKHFFQWGYQRVVVDEIASELGMSKKTLYQYFKSKEDIFREVLNRRLTIVLCECENIVYSKELPFNAKLKNLILYHSGMLAVLSPPLMKDLQFKFPELWEKLNELRLQKIPVLVNDLLEEGMKNGFFRSNIDRQLVVLIFTTLIDKLIHPSVLSGVSYTASEIFDEIMKLFYWGLMSEEARKDSALQEIQNASKV